MSRTTASLLRILALAPLATGLFACKAFDLGAETEAAQAANESVRGYPRLAEIPPEPADIECLRAGVSDSLIVTEAPEAASGGRNGAVDADGRTYQVQVTPPAPASGPNFDNLLSAARALADDVLGEEEEREAAPGPQLVDCPPGPGILAEQLAARRDRLQEAAAAIRAQAPEAPAPVTPPPGMAPPVPVSVPVPPSPRR